MRTFKLGNVSFAFLLAKMNDQQQLSAFPCAKQSHKFSFQPECIHFYLYIIYISLYFNFFFRFVLFCCDSTTPPNNFAHKARFSWIELRIASTIICMWKKCFENLPSKANHINYETRNKIFATISTISTKKFPKDAPQIRLFFAQKENEK